LEGLSWKSTVGGGDADDHCAGLGRVGATVQAYHVGLGRVGELESGEGYVVEVERLLGAGEGVVESIKDQILALIIDDGCIVKGTAGLAWTATIGMVEIEGPGHDSQ